VISAREIRRRRRVFRRAFPRDVTAEVVAIIVVVVVELAGSLSATNISRRRRWFGPRGRKWAIGSFSNFSMDAEVARLRLFSRRPRRGRVFSRRRINDGRHKAALLMARSGSGSGDRDGGNVHEGLFDVVVVENGRQKSGGRKGGGGTTANAAEREVSRGRGHGGGDVTRTRDGGGRRLLRSTTQ